MMKTFDMLHLSALSWCQLSRLVLAAMFYSSAFLVVIAYALSWLHVQGNRAHGEKQDYSKCK